MQYPQEPQQRREPSVANKNRPKSSFLSWILSDNGHNKSSSSTVSTASIQSMENSRFGNGNNNHCLKVKLQMPGDDVDEAKSCTNTEYANRNTNSATKKDKSPMVVPEAIASFQQVQIPDRRQSHLYTRFHENEERGNREATTLFDYKHRSYYTSQLSPEINVTDVTSSSSTSLTRSASWQPSSSSSSSQLPLSQLLSPPPVPPPHNYHLCAGTAENSIPARRTSRNYNSEDPEIQAKLNAVLNSEKATYLSYMINNNSLSNTSIYRRSTTPGSRKL